jgi:hypothetical protein
VSSNAAQELAKKRWKGTTAEDRSEHMRRAVQARWEAYYKAHPEKRKTARTGESRNVNKRGKRGDN